MGFSNLFAITSRLSQNSRLCVGLGDHMRQVRVVGRYSSDAVNNKQRRKFDEKARNFKAVRRGDGA